MRYALSGFSATSNPARALVLEGDTMERHYTLRIQPWNVKDEPYTVCGFWEDEPQARIDIYRAVAPAVIIGVEETRVCA